MSSILFPALCTSKNNVPSLSMQNMNVSLRYVGPIKCPLGHFAGKWLVLIECN